MSNTIKISSPLPTAHKIKQNLEDQIRCITNQPEIFAQSPTDFSRSRKLSFETTLKIILSFGGQSLASELLSHFDFSLQTPTTSAFIQARSKIKLKAFEQLFNQTNPLGSKNKHYKGYQVLVHDGSDINIPYNKSDSDTHHIAGKFRKHMSLLHLNALYDPLNKRYVSVDLQKNKKLDERQSLCQMVDAFNFTNPTIIIADRGYESFNVYEHIKKSGQKFLIRVKDTKSNGLLKGLRLPSKGPFDTELTLQLTRRRTNEVKADKRYQYIRKTASFDYLPLQSKESYPINLRVVRIKLSEDY
ncbi:hypothetical protein A5819_001546 [Enterococcus sp. 7E2_DIV0204]|nr:hypothetical protein A5819_001546 [Enterococcus sp. 7E2_DIV0204]OTP51509.1 hypothetical protein A5884_000704 [Enterococcus sp. 7D2_DIV0200]